MKDVKIEKCQYCGGEEFIESTVLSYTHAALSTSATHNATLFATVCRDCGSVVRMFCKTPENLYPKKERRK